MKQKLLFFILIFTFFRVFALNKITLSSGQKSLISVPENIQQDYELSELEEAVCFNGRNPEEVFTGTYCIFKDYSYSKTQNKKAKTKYLSRIIYIYPDGKTFRDVLSINENESYTLEQGIKYEQEREYIKFDDSGRLFINVSKKSEGLSGILMYSPKNDKKYFFWLPKEYKTIEDFALSSDGKYIIVSGNNGLSTRSTQAFLFFTDEELKDPKQLLYINASKLSSLVYNPENQNFYMIASFYDPALENDESGKICVLPYLNNTYSEQSMKYFTQREIKNGKALDFWNNVLVIDQLNNKIYATSNPGITYPGDGQLHELIDNVDSLELKPVEETANILFHSTDYYGNGKVLKSTPLGLFLIDKNQRAYLFKDSKLTETTHSSIYQNLEEYNQKISISSRSENKDVRYKDVIKTKEEENTRLQKTEKTLILLLGLLAVIAFTLCFALIIVIAHKKILIRKTLQKRILELQESERAKLSRDIHDSVVQDIRAIRLQTELIETDGSPKSQQQKERVIEDITQTIVKMRNICYNLTPAEIITHQDGDSAKIELISVLDTLCQQFYVKTKIPCSLQIDTELVYPEYDKETSLHLVRIFQELLNNIEKHSYATNVNVLVRNKVEGNQNHLVIFVIDDGIGCNIQQCLKSRKKNHFGLNNIQERIKLIGGQIEFYSSQNEGMKIKITVKM